MLERITLFIRKIFIRFRFFSIKKNPHAVKWGIIGLGNMAEVMSSAINGNKDAVVHAVASRTLKKAQLFAKRNGGCKAYGSYDEMLNDSSCDIDIIYIATPMTEHYKIIKKCLLLGKNVICEKSITSNAEQLRKLILLSEKNNCFLMEAMWMKCLPTFRKAIELIDEKKIGNIELIKVDFYKKEIIKPDLTIFNAEKGGGVLLDYGVYAISFMITFLKGIPDTIEYSNRVSVLGIDTDWNITAQKNNTKAFINISSGFGSQSKAVIIGDKGSLEWESQFNRTNKITLFDPFGNKIEHFKFKYKFEGFEHQIQEVTRSLRAKEKESLFVPLNETYDTLIVLDKLRVKLSN